ncbi:MAG: alanine dehydrogenase [Deltaproteobacteria bacterium]|nr:alanine dehydrogenase [Deltaproteobacteria bacterium]|tara:strand:+ start:548 stop:1651 length:1104 start_codon:yes stop_codon:yes gene_type:complete
MLVGVPKEIKPQENRVGLVPAGVRQLVQHGHKVIVEQNAGSGSGLPDNEFIAAGAEIVSTAEEVWGRADMIWKVKEPIAAEYPRLRENQILYTYLHLAPDRPQTDALLNAGVVGIAYETVQDTDGSLPLLKPMSEVAGRLSVQAGARCLERVMGGRGVLLGGVPGVPPGKVMVIGGGIVGLNAVRMAMGMGADVTVLDINIDQLRWFDNTFQGRVKTLYSSTHNLENALGESDLVIGAVLVAGARAPHLVTKEHLSLMQPGAAIVDVAVDQGGCVETTHATTHAEPTYIVDGIVHYAVANMPGAVARTSTFALNNATLRQGIKIADLGWKAAIENDPSLRPGLNVCGGKITYKAVADAHNLPYEPID